MGFTLETFKSGSNGSVKWNVTFIRRVHDWEVEVLNSFYKLLYSHTMHGEGEDRMWWIPSHKGKFEVRSFTGSLLPKIPSLFLGKVFGALRFLREWLFLLGRPRLERL